MSQAAPYLLSLGVSKAGMSIVFLAGASAFPVHCKTPSAPSRQRAFHAHTLSLRPTQVRSRDSSYNLSLEFSRTVVVRLWVVVVPSSLAAAR